MKFKILFLSLVFIIPIVFLLGSSNSDKNFQLSLSQALNGEKILKIRVYKSARTLEVLTDKGVAKSYKIALGKEPTGHKRFEGDMRTPEGNYTINDKNPNSAYHLNLGISYPNKDDIAYAKSMGKSAGGDIKIHGLPNKFSFLGDEIFFSFGDWTHGCIAVRNSDIEELFEAVEIGTPIEILP
ncbi:MAG: L,D-transpeptidase family protein [Campylobacter sp.]|nr:L,D-transpeptidase family protein [Campylobacter sp.]